MARRIKREESSDDIGEERLVKAELVRLLSSVISAQGLSQRKMAARLGIDQPKISALLNGQTKGYSIERLIGFLVALNQDVTIVVAEHSATSLEPAGVRITNNTALAS